MSELDKLEMIHDKLHTCFGVVMLGVILLGFLNVWYWRKL